MTSLITLSGLRTLWNQRKAGQYLPQSWLEDSKRYLSIKRQAVENFAHTCTYQHLKAAKAQLPIRACRNSFSISRLICSERDLMPFCAIRNSNLEISASVKQIVLIFRLMKESSYPVLLKHPVPFLGKNFLSFPDIENQYVETYRNISKPNLKHIIPTSSDQNNNIGFIYSGGDRGVNTSKHL